MRGLVKNYEQKMRMLLLTQKREGVDGWETFCPLSNVTISPVTQRDPDSERVFFIDVLSKDKIDFCHGLSNTKHNRKNYPYYIDSILNGCAGLHNCHISSLYPNYPDNIDRADHEIYLINDYLSGHDSVIDWRRGGDERAFFNKVVNGWVNVNEISLKKYMSHIDFDVKEMIIQEG